MIILFISKEEKTIQVYKYDEYEKKRNVQIVITQDRMERRKEGSVGSLAYYTAVANAWISEYGEGLEFCDIQIIPEDNSVVQTFCPECGAKIMISVSHIPTKYAHSCENCNAAIAVKFGP